MASSVERRKKQARLVKGLLLVLYGSAAAVFLTYLVRGGGYYLTPLSERPFHPDYRAFRPAGGIGLRLGIAGTVLMWLLLFYSLRKRTRVFGGLFPLKYWLDVHIFCGVAGPLFIMLHTSFKFDGLVAISFWSMVAVACSGLFGRYLYIQIPRNIRGQELDIRQLEERDRELTDDLRAHHNLSGEQVDELTALLEDERGQAKQSLPLMLWRDLRRGLVLRRAARTLPDRFGISREGAAKLLVVARRKAVLRRRIARLSTIHRAFHYWHVIHRPFAVIMYAIMLVHIVVALMFGISWRTG